MESLSPIHLWITPLTPPVFVAIIAGVASAVVVLCRPSVVIVPTTSNTAPVPEYCYILSDASSRILRTISPLEPCLNTIPSPGSLISNWLTPVIL